MRLRADNPPEILKSSDGAMITLPLNPANSNSSLLNGIKPVVQEVNSAADRKSLQPSVLANAQAPSKPVNAVTSAEALAEVKDAQGAKTEVDRPKSSEEDALAAKGYSRIETLSAKDAAANIMDFVRQGLAQASSRGKSTAELQVMLDQARQGVAEGYAEALQELDNLGLMNDELAGSIQNSRDLVEAGLNEVDAQLASGGLAVKEPQSSMEGQPFLGQSSLQQSLSLELTTREGDRVTVLWGQSESRSLGFNRSDNGAGMQAEFASQSGLMFEIQGDLNEQERKDIEGFLQASVEFADRFFQGSSSMMQEAMNYVEMFSGLDSLSTMDLQLSQTRTQKMAGAYEEIDQLPTPALTPKDTMAELAPQVMNELGLLQELADKALVDQQQMRPLFQSMPEMMQAEPKLGQSFLKFMEAFFGESGLAKVA